MRAYSVDSPAIPGRLARPGRLDRLARRLLDGRLGALSAGQIVISEAGRHATYGELTDEFPLTAQVVIHDPRFYSDVVFGGSIGAGEAYIRGYWSCAELTELVRILLRNRPVLDRVEYGLARLTEPAQRFLHWLNKNTRRGSRRNIAAHYDLGNDFYRLWLDERMMYSSAYFEHADMSLDAAAVAKLDRICRLLELSPSDSIMEIGSGWGGFAIFAARNYGCRVTTTTISEEQYAYASQAIAAAGLEDRITLLLEDYRDLTGSYDKLVSIEMIEAVGHQFHAEFFRKCCELLKPDGKMLLQAITIKDQRYERYKSEPDFIRRFIFPGGCLTSVTDMVRTMTKHTDMRVIALEDIGLHYATTLRHWHGRFLAAADRIREMGYPEEFIRMWEYYLCFCEGAFAEREIGDVQMLIMRPEAR
jgi:cyclopropane-fatty-acyl-phospholipid synthase